MGALLKRLRFLCFIQGKLVCNKSRHAFRVSFLRSGIHEDMKHIIASCSIWDFGFVCPLQCCIIQACRNGILWHNKVLIDCYVCIFERFCIFSLGGRLFFFNEKQTCIFRKKPEKERHRGKGLRKTLPEILV